MKNFISTRVFTISMVVVLVLQTHYSQCYISPCSVTTMTCPNEISSGNGEEQMTVTAAGTEEQLNQTNRTDNYSPESKYVLETSIGLGADASVIEITLKFTSCIPYNHEDPTGPKWFKVEAISNSTGETVGEFNTPPFHTEAELCSNNVIAFKTKNPTVLDMPRTYRWKPTAQVEESVCFRATIFHYPDNTCETITKCLPSDEIPAPAAVNDNNRWSNVVITPNADTVEKCKAQWDCENPNSNWKTGKPHCTCNPLTKKCKLFSMKCKARREKCYYKDILSLDIHKVKNNCSALEETLYTEPPTTPTPPPPTPSPVKGYCKLIGSRMTCSSTGDFKLSQCLKASDTEYSCFCVSYIGVQKVISERKIRIGTCDSPSTYDLHCIHD